MDALASELYYIAVEAEVAGRSAVIDDGTVAILTPARRCFQEGPAYVSFQVNRVRSVAEAQQLLQSRLPA